MAQWTTKINPSAMDFAFRLSKYDCYRKRTGKCSLLLTEKEYATEIQKEKQSKKSYGDGSVRKCVDLKNSLLEHGNQSDIRITSNSCNHWAITDGQHRLCIYKTLNISNIEVIESQGSDYICRVCYFKKKSFKFRIKSYLGLEREFVR
ncbi:hypothetical protein EEL30_21900 [Brevibacillus laterosporus]|uniref:Uncharacterized protein n=1 Tax=Brevibacillus laterosporus TaxID=1465 RepID=A0A518VCI3_BRELA|nr:hypothetical protein EEL30_21900 [Brevibacillus laterosporus]